MSSSDLNILKQRLRANTRPIWAEARDWCFDVYRYTNAVVAWMQKNGHSPKNLSMALSAEVAEIVEHLTNHGCSNVVGTGSTGATQWLTEEQSKNKLVPRQGYIDGFSATVVFRNKAHHEGNGHSPKLIVVRSNTSKLRCFYNLRCSGNRALASPQEGLKSQLLYA